MKTFNRVFQLTTIVIVSFVAFITLFTQMNATIQAAPTTDLDVCAACTYTTIQTAVNAANPGDTIRVAQDTYQDTITATGLLTTTVLITKDLTLIGGYSPDFQTHDPATYETIIDGQNIAKGFYVFGASAHIEGFTIINSLNQGILVRTDFDTNPGSATIINNHIHNNPGTGIVFYQAAGEVLSNTLAHNIWEGVAVAEAKATISSNTVTNNSLAGIWASNSTVTIMGNEILSNTAEGGGGITLDDATVFTVTHNTIANNQAQLYGGGGIAIFDGATGSIAFNTITDNVSADCCGGGITAYANGDLIIANNTITANYSQSGGGGLDLNPDDTTFGTTTFITITENSIQENIGSYGSGVALNNVNGGTYITANDIRLNEMVVNTPDFQSGGIHIWGSSGPTEIVNNVLVQNANRALKAANFSQIEVINNTMVGNGAMGIETFAWPVTPTLPYTTTVVNNIVVGHSECGVTGFNGVGMYADYNLFHDNDTDICLTTAVPPHANIFADPQFIDAAAGNVRLQTGSPAIDSGTTGPNIPNVDIEGTIRPQGSGIDVGAYEAIRQQIFLPFMTNPHQISNIASGKTVQITTNGANDLSPGAGLSPADVTDGSLVYEPASSGLEDGVIGFVNNDYFQEMAVTVTIDLGGIYNITSIRYNMGNILFGDYWNADTMISPFQTTNTNPGGSYSGAWTEHVGSATLSSVTLTFKKTRETFYEDWLFIGEVEIYGTPAN